MTGCGQIVKGLDHQMKIRQVDLEAAQMPWMAGLLPCLYVPIAARDSSAIEAFVGRIHAQISPRSKNKALLVMAHKPEKPDARLRIWSLPTAAVLHHPLQVWVHVNYSCYRRAYTRGFPDTDLTDFVIDHVMNRRVARLKGFHYLRVVPVARAVNSSHGGLSERWAVEYHSLPRMLEFNRASKTAVQYADLSDIVKMINMEGGGSLMEIVNQAQKLVDVSNEK
jgi:hypothetical protein